MRSIAYLVLINNAYPETIAFDKDVSLEIAERFNPKAAKHITRTYTERRSASELAKMLAFDNCETREEVLRRVRNELAEFWKQKNLL
ncbi:MAG: hypothetical protein JXK05_14265 [Campylobacterales bacterium]|nr:hypothetical protein [Campylobacterales bacterium]